MDITGKSIVSREALESEVTIILEAYLNLKYSFISNELIEKRVIISPQISIKNAIQRFQTESIVSLTDLTLSRFRQTSSLALSKIDPDSLSVDHQIILKSLTEFLINRISQAISAQIQRDTITIKRVAMDLMLEGDIDLNRFYTSLANSKFVYIDSLGRKRLALQFITSEIRNLFFLHPNFLVILKQKEISGEVMIRNPKSKSDGLVMPAVDLLKNQDRYLYPGSEFLVTSE
jgi:hypothetical protein